jgi:hypothetical protein
MAKLFSGLYIYLFKEIKEEYEKSDNIYILDPGLAACGVCRRNENPHSGSC